MVKLGRGLFPKPICSHSLWAASREACVFFPTVGLLHLATAGIWGGSVHCCGELPMHGGVPPSIPGLSPLNANSTLRIFKPTLMASNVSGWQIKGFSFLLFTSSPLPSPPLLFPPQFSICKNQQKRESLVGKCRLESQVFAHLLCYPVPGISLPPPCY